MHIRLILTNFNSPNMLDWRALECLVRTVFPLKGVGHSHTKSKRISRTLND
jgi:hypothetical protein